MVDHFIKCETVSQGRDKNSQSPYPLLLTNSQIENLCLWIRGSQWAFRWIASHEPERGTLGTLQFPCQNVNFMS